MSELLTWAPPSFTIEQCQHFGLTCFKRNLTFLFVYWITSFIGKKTGNGCKVFCTETISQNSQIAPWLTSEWISEGDMILSTPWSFMQNTDRTEYSCYFNFLHPLSSWMSFANSSFPPRNKRSMFSWSELRDVISPSTIDDQHSVCYHNIESFSLWSPCFRFFYTRKSLQMIPVTLQEGVSVSDGVLN